ncbi:Pol Polyprotein [Phytophthora megakarya]|uniref:Pol Polyprotein n=1 Tax=Phytophthora megakarya TaxID=4795 RepID=A0A225VIU2_9STRA|nr:Pol Polyprotein [Phytophthora megakarya]
MDILDVTGEPTNVHAVLPKKHLDDAQRKRLLKLLQSFRLVTLQGGIGELRRKPYILPVLPDAQPRAYKPYPIPVIHRQAVLDEVKRLVSHGVLEPDKDSPWAAPCFVIPKKDGTVRFLTDFRGLNRALGRAYYPLSKTQDLIRELPQPEYVSALDLTMGYYSRVLAEESRPYTAIVLPWGKYRYCRMPMGISTAPDEFQAVMQELLGGLPFVRIYLDDVFVLSSSFDDHLEHLQEVLQRTQGKRPLQKKIEAISQIAKPRNIRDLRRFIGMINYYKDMWKARSETLAPLTALTSLYTDASQHQLGGVIMQKGKPLAFWSRKCTTTQEQYTMNKKELLSVVEMLREFRSILWGRKLKIYTDHKNSVQSTFNKPHMLRWRLEIEEYGPELVYIKGHENIVADALSRLPLHEKKHEGAAADVEPEFHSLSLGEIAEAQHRSGLQEGAEVCWRSIGGTKVLVGKAKGKMILPPELVNKVRNTYHQWLMHPGERVMLESLKETLTWPGMTESVRSWMRNCKQCARNKDRGPRYGKLPKNNGGPAMGGKCSRYARSNWFGSKMACNDHY